MSLTDDERACSPQDCPHLSNCGIFQTFQEKVPGLIKRFKDHYCHKYHRACSRRWVQDFLGAEKVPELMMPQQHDWAEQLLFESGVRYSAFQEKYQVPVFKTASTKETL